MNTIIFRHNSNNRVLKPAKKSINNDKIELFNILDKCTRKFYLILSKIVRIIRNHERRSQSIEKIYKRR